MSLETPSSPGAPVVRAANGLAPAGPTNSLVDVPGLRVGQYERIGDGWLSGTTVVRPPDDGAVAGVDVRGGGPGTRETDLLDPRNLVDRVHAICLTGGSAFGLAAADGVMEALYEAGVGFPMGGPGEVVPIVPTAVIFDLGRGGDFGRRPGAEFGRLATAAASPAPPRLGVVGAGTGAKVGGLKGGVGSASAVLEDGSTVAALIVCNALGSAIHPDTGLLHAAPYLVPQDLADLVVEGRLGAPAAAQLAAAPTAASGEELRPATATTIGVVATDATLSKAQCAKLAGIGHDGLARALRPVHTMFDGDTLFGLATGTRPAPEPPQLHRLLEVAADVVTRAVARAVLAATSVTTPGGAWPGYLDVLPSVGTRAR